MVSYAAKTGVSDEEVFKSLLVFVAGVLLGIACCVLVWMFVL